MKLTNKQKKFIEEYLIDLNATKAAIRAGYSEKTAHAQGYENLIKLDSFISKKLNEHLETAQVKTNRLLQEETSIAFLDPIELFDGSGEMKAIRDIPPNVRRAIKSIETFTDKKDRKRVKISFWDKGKSLKRLGDYLNMYNKLTLEGNPEKPISIEGKKDLIEKLLEKFPDKEKTA